MCIDLRKITDCSFFFYLFGWIHRYQKCISVNDLCEIYRRKFWNKWRVFKYLQEIYIYFKYWWIWTKQVCSGLVGQLQSNNFVNQYFPCVIHQSVLCCKVLKLHETIAIVTKVVNKFKGGHNALTNRGCPRRGVLSLHLA